MSGTWKLFMVFIATIAFIDPTFSIQSSGFVQICCDEDFVEMSLKPTDEPRKSVQIDWTPMSCRLDKDNPTACEDMACSITFNIASQNGKENYDHVEIQIRPWWRQGKLDSFYPNKCDKLTAMLRKGYNASAAFPSLPIDGCSILKLPEVKNEDMWKRCIENPFQPLETDKFKDDVMEIQLTTTFVNHTVEKESHFLVRYRSGTGKHALDEGEIPFWEVLSDPPTSPPFLRKEGGNCSKLYLPVKNRLPVPVTVEITFYPPAPGDVVSQAARLEPYGELNASLPENMPPGSAAVDIKKIEGVHHIWNLKPGFLNEGWAEKLDPLPGCSGWEEEPM